MHVLDDNHIPEDFSSRYLDPLHPSWVFGVLDGEPSYCKDGKEVEIGCYTQEDMMLAWLWLVWDQNYIYHWPLLSQSIEQIIEEKIHIKWMRSIEKLNAFKEITCQNGQE